MKLNEIKRVTEGTVSLTEGVIPVHLTMTLDQIVDEGRVTNSVQYFTLAGLINMFKDGGPYRWPRDINSYEMATGADIIEAVKTLSDAESVNIATWLRQALEKPGSFETNCQMSSHPTDTVGWVKWALSKQA